MCNIAEYDSRITLSLSNNSAHKVPVNACSQHEAEFPCLVRSRLGVYNQHPRVNLEGLGEEFKGHLEVGKRSGQSGRGVYRPSAGRQLGGLEGV